VRVYQGVPELLRPRRNDSRVVSHQLDSGVRILTEDGWAGFSLSRVAQSVGTSIRPVRSRVPDPPSLAAWQWTEVLQAPLPASLKDVVDTVIAHNQPGIVSALAAMPRVDQGAIATVETLIVSNYHPVIHAAVDTDLDDFLRTHLDTPRSRSTK
jgi:hypothetical protein